MLTLLEIIKRSTDFLGKHGVENPRLQAELLVGHALGLARMQLYLQFERPLTEPELAKIRPMVKRRSDREPLQYIVGSTEFAGLTLKVDKRALIPRPETEYLIELLVQQRPTPPRTVLDLGTGTGAIALALAKAWPEAEVTAVEESHEALALARENAAALGLESRVQLLASDWFAALSRDARYDLIVSNPPYLSDAETEATEIEVKDFEPKSALSAGEDGARDLEQIIREAPKHLVAGGLLALETGIAQHSRLLEQARAHGFVHAESRRDLTGRDRYILASV